MTPQDQRIAPCLWFDGKAEEAASFYVALFPNSRIERTLRSGVDWPGGKAGGVVLVSFTLNGEPFQALNGGKHDTFNDAVSFSVPCKDQAETDRLWDALIAGGGKAVQCGWLIDRYGVRWQIVPQEFLEMMHRAEGEQARRLMTAMMSMVKLDVAELKRAYDG
ncbi:MAG: VOC family protein [Hyphomicrobiales bacterium]